MCVYLCSHYDLSVTCQHIQSETTSALFTCVVIGQQLLCVMCVTVCHMYTRAHILTHSVSNMPSTSSHIILSVCTSLSLSLSHTHTHTHRMLQEDKRCHTQIMSPSGSIPSLPDSILSTDSTGAAAANDEHASQTSQQSQDSTSSQQEAEERLKHPVRRFNTKERARSESEITKMSVDSLSEGGLKRVEGGLKKSPAIASLKEETDVKKRDRSQSELTKKSSTLMSEDLSAEVTTGGRGEKQEWSSEEDLWQKWSPLLKNWEESERKSQKLIRQLARQGIPAQLRGMAWQLMAGAHDQELKDKYPVLITVGEMGALSMLLLPIFDSTV